MEVYEDFEGTLEAEYKGNASRGGHVESFRIGGGPRDLAINMYIYIYVYSTCIHVHYVWGLVAGSLVWHNMGPVLGKRILHI